MKTDLHQKLYHSEDTYWWSVCRRKMVTSFLRKKPQSKKNKIIDLGCGGGALASELQEFGKTYGLDLSQAALTSYQKKQNNSAIMGDVTALPLQENTFNIITALDLLEHVPDEKRFLQELSRILTKDGTVVLLVPALMALWTERDLQLGHKRRYSLKNLRTTLTGAGFHVEKIYYANVSLVPVLFILSLKEKFFKKSSKKDFNEIHTLPSFFNQLFIAFLSLENQLSAYIPFPFGSSLFCILKKNEDTQ